MKKNWYRIGACATILGVVSLVQSCSVSDVVNDFFPGFTFPANPVDFTIPISSAGSDFVALDSIKVEMDIDSAIRATSSGTVGVSDADRIFIESVRLELTDGDNDNNWANFSEVNMAMTSNAASGIVQMTKATIPDTYDVSIDGTVDQSISMKEYVKGNTIYYVLYGKLRRATNKELHGKAFVSYRIE